ncbi:P-loop containing nucleoside triphosphate hydrolase protein [Suillus tomentosus]|nr:P-loop containing nucleoside triphosphate hydrolase protein [Suillus tomentosus]
MGSVSRSSVAPRPLVKIEPTEELSFSDSGHDDTPLSGSLVASNIKVESVIEPTLYHLYEFADEITYTPEHALREGLGMVKTLKIGIEKLELGSSKLRKDVWLREIDSLLNQVSPTTMIAVCGATGAGKSSTINALLDVDVVPTSGMRACTSVVTEISYHTAPTINADVLFLSKAEWREELIVLLDDIQAEGSNLKRTTDLHGDSEVAWYKVHAVYPSITLPQLVDMTADQMLAYNTNIVHILGTTRKISADDSSSFAQQIARYVDSSTGQKRRGKKNKPRKGKKTSASDNLVISAEEKEDHDTALWPLIRQVNIQCNARALSTGAILVDLPGVADVNPARNRIAKDYMKKCNCIWILAPITRAVDDKTARDGNYDAHTITFIATKCDDISCSEVITTLDLKDDPALKKINKCIISCKKETSELKLKKADTESLTEVILGRLKRLQAVIQQCQEGKTALANGTMLMPQFTATAHQATQSMGKKRKNTHSKEAGPAKHLKSSTFGQDSEDDTSDSDMYVDDTCGGQKSVEEEQEKEDTQHDDGIKDEPEEVTVKVLDAKIDDAQKSIKAAWEELDDARKAQINIKGALDDLMRKEMEARRDKSTFCSLKRSEENPPIQT